MNQKKIIYYVSFLAAIFITACTPDNGPIEEDILPGSKTLWILSEGSFNQNNSTLVHYDVEAEKLTRDYFRSVNNRGLGDTGNDMLVYGSKLYIVVNVSSTIEVLNAATGTSIAQISMKQEDGSPKQPRQIATHGGKVYVTSYDDTVTRIDTASLTIDGTIQVGLDPEGIVIQNNKLYVANSGGLNFLNGYDNTVSVIDIATFKEEKRIEVGTNPANLDADNRGNIYVSIVGDYGATPPSFKRINAATGEVATIEEIPSPGRFLVSDNKAYIVSGSFGSPYKVMVFDCLTQTVVRDQFITDGTEIESIHNISRDEGNGDLFIMAADYTAPSSVYCFDKEGKLKYTLPAVGINPTAVVVLD